MISGGNPFYALELARAMDDGRADVGASLPGTLAELVRDRISRHAGNAATSAARACPVLPTPRLSWWRAPLTPTLNNFCRSSRRPRTTASSRLPATVFASRHPLLAHGVYTDATAGGAGQCIGDWPNIVDEPELKARHLALAAATGDALTLRSLDEGSRNGSHSVERRRPRAELVDLAIGLGGDTPEQAREVGGPHHFNAGDAAHARNDSRAH